MSCTSTLWSNTYNTDKNVGLYLNDNDQVHQCTAHCYLKSSACLTQDMWSLTGWPLCLCCLLVICLISTFILLYMRLFLRWHMKCTNLHLLSLITEEEKGCCVYCILLWVVVHKTGQKHTVINYNSYEVIYKNYKLLIYMHFIFFK